MFGLGFWEIAVVLVLALLVFGPKKLPDLARGLGKSIREFRRATEDFKATIEDEAHRPAAPRSSDSRALLTPASAGDHPPPAETPLALPSRERSTPPAAIGVQVAASSSPDAIDAAPSREEPSTSRTTSSSSSANRADDQ